MKRIAIAILAMGGCLAATEPQASERSDTQGAALSNVIAKCDGCHGPRGDSTSTATPRLNGQQAGYIAARLRSLRDPTRQTPHATHAMFSTSSNVGDETIDALAKHYAGQAPTPAQGRGPLAAEGRKLYANGGGERIPACQSCHGAAGQGTETAPRLAGQHADYLTDQMDAFVVMNRVNDPMQTHPWFITNRQIKALVSYLAND